MKKNDIDVEIVELVKAINSNLGVRTTSSCFGHGKAPVRIWFELDSNNLNKFLFEHFNTVNTWHIKIENADIKRGSNKLQLLLESEKMGDEVLPEIPIMTRNFMPKDSNGKEISTSAPQ